jgi:hypothetical protein
VALSHPENTCDPPYEQWLVGLEAGAYSSIVVWPSLGVGRLALATVITSRLDPKKQKDMISWLTRIRMNKKD